MDKWLNEVVHVDGDPFTCVPDVAIPLFSVLCSQQRKYFPVNQKTSIAFHHQTEGHTVQIGTG